MPDNAQAIGKAFADILRDYLSPREWQEMRERNAQETDSRICHSHDFCDANMPMQEAFERVMGRDIFNAEGTISDSDMTLWNSAWTYASENYLTERASA